MIAAFQARRDSLLYRAIPEGTLANERSSWSKWLHHCRAWGTHPVRDNLEAYGSDPAARADMLTLAASFIEYCYLTMLPRARNTFPKPKSAYKNWCDVQRILQRKGCPRLDPTQLAQYVKALTLEYKQMHGFDALLEKRKEPIRDLEFAHLLALPPGMRLGPFVYHPDSRFGLTWRALHQVLNHSGFRKGEWAVSRHGAATLMTFAQLAWQLNGVVTKAALTAVQRALISGGKVVAYAIIFPVPSKCDPDGSAFCNKGIPFPVAPTDPECAGTLLLRLEALVQPQDRRAVPLFSDEAGGALVGSDMDRALHDALALYNPRVAATRSWHSYRIRLASKLRAARSLSGAPAYSDDVIQALLRWKTPASLQIYARYNTATYAAILRSVSDEDITSIQYANLPETSELDRMEVLASNADTGLISALAVPTAPASTMRAALAPRMLATPMHPDEYVPRGVSRVAAASTPAAGTSASDARALARPPHPRHQAPAAKRRRRTTTAPAPAAISQAPLRPTPTPAQAPPNSCPLLLYANRPSARRPPTLRTPVPAAPSPRTRRLHA